MANINFLGAASGLPLEDLVTSFVNSEREIRFGRINKTKATLDASLSGVGKLKSALSAFQDAANKLSGDKFKQRSALVTQPIEGKSFIEATANSNASASSFDIKVNQIAQGSRLESADLAFSSADDVIATSDGKLTFTAGSKSFDVDVTAGMTLEQLRLKINDSSANFSVNANIINAGGSVGTKLVLNSSETGEGNDLVISNDNAELDAISTQPTGVSAGLSSVQAAQNAIVEIDGIIATSATNKFDNVIQDISLTVVAKTPEGNNAKLDVDVDKDAAKTNIKAFLDSYNQLVDQVANLTKNRTLGADGQSVTGANGALKGDPLPGSIMSQLRNILGSTISGSDPQMNSLYSLGVTLNKEGKLEINTSTEYSETSGQMRFNKALDENFDAIGKMFGNESGLITKLDSFIKEFNKSGGVIASKESSINSQIANNTKASEAASRYIESFEKSLRSRYQGLDVLLAEMQRTQANVASALSSLPGFGTTNKT
ncbi:flagellar filament capping protein FliD [Rheinheimera salexigens]|uniref:Flagellar hook-associated protein 2 n=1 Tax=Rheinheimera salexigens TaxID=1628148 RepID=A0A1E7Q865_9GAMM|nr:flagellar filament capping protein FliD [Rheinheimera salexigens]OEY70300.1 flagellar cap protein [Rheinheimera salexigens]